MNEDDRYFNELRTKALNEKEDSGPFIRFLENIFPFTKDYEPVYKETLKDTPAGTQDLMEQFLSKENRTLGGFQKSISREYEDFNGRGPGVLYISDDNGKAKFNFYPKPPQDWIDKQNLTYQRSDFVANFFIHTAPVLSPLAMKTQPTYRVRADGSKHKITEGGKTLLQQRKSNKQILGEFEVTGYGKTNIAEIVNDVSAKPPVDVRAIIKIAKQNNISYKQAEAYLEMLKTGVKPDMDIKPGSSMTKQMQGIENKGLIKDFTSGSLKKNSLFSPNYRPPNLMFTEDAQKTSTSDILGGIKRKRQEPYPDYVKRVLIANGAKYDDNGDLIMWPEDFFAIKNPNVRREVAQLILTDLNQGVKGSFLAQKRVKNPELDKALERYNKKYAAHADLHHGYPSVIGIEFFLGIPLWGKTWQSQMQVAASYNNFPGQPMVEGKNNLVSLPSSVPSQKTRKWGPVTKVTKKNPVYHQAKKALEKEGRKIPQHLHQLIHDAFLTNEMGQRGQKFWKKWDPIIGNAVGPAQDQAWVDAYVDFNDIISRNRAVYNEGIAQLEAIFSNSRLKDTDKLVDILEEFVAKGKVSIGKGIVRGKDGKPVILKKGDKTTLSTIKTADYSQDAVTYELEDIALSFKKAIRDERLNEDPRFKNVAEEIEYFPELTDRERLRMEELLYEIQWYHSIFITDGARRAWHVTGITKPQHKSNLKEYYDLMQPKLFKLPEGAPEPSINTLKKLQTTTFEDVKPPDKEQMIQLIFEFKAPWMNNKK